MSNPAKAKRAEDVIATDVDVARSFSLVHSLRNYSLPSSDELYHQDINAFFDGEEGYDFTHQSNLSNLDPKAAAEAAQPLQSSKQQQQNIPAVGVLQAKYTQQQQQKLQLVI